MNDLSGQTVGRYHLLQPLGEGGMAAVYKAFDTRLERTVAVKVIRTDKETRPEFLQRFKREAMALAQLEHPNIVHINDYGEQDGVPYVVMAYMPGGTLKKKLGQPIPYPEAARLLAPIARALDYAHRRGIIHRDVKPANILLTEDGQPMLSDFGIAKILQEGITQITTAGVGLGTPDYMSPEQWLGQVDARSDIYSLGIILYELVTGRRPYIADTPAAVLLKQVNDPLPLPRQYVPSLPDFVEQVILNALAKKPEDRYPDMAAFAAALERLTSPPVPSPQKAWRGETSRAPIWLIGAGALVLVGICAAAAVLIGLWVSRPTNPAPNAFAPTKAISSTLQKTPARTARATETAAATEVQVSTDAVFPSNTSKPADTLTPEPPSSTPSSTSTSTPTPTQTSTPPLMTRIVYPRCNCLETVTAKESIIVRLRWLATTKELAEKGARAVTYDLYIDGKLVSNIDQYRQSMAVYVSADSSTKEGWAVYWDYPLGLLNSGQYVIKAVLNVLSETNDGWDTYKPGRKAPIQMTLDVSPGE